MKILNIQSKESDGKLVIQVYQPRQDRVSKHDAYNNLFVKNFPTEYKSADLRKMFEPYGAISSCTVMESTEGESKNFGFVCYEDPNAAVKAATTLHVDETEKKGLYVKRAMKKENRRQ